MAGVYGVQAYEADIETLWNGRLRASGAAWVRARAMWAAIEPANTTPRTREWGMTDSVIRGLGLHGFKGLVSIYRHPSWAATTDCGAIDLVPLARYGEFVRDLVERYDGDGVSDAPGSPRVAYWEISNEPDFAPSEAGGEDDYGGCFGDDPAGYGRLLREAYAAVKTSDPSATVVFGAVAYDRFADNPDYPPENEGPFRFMFVRGVLEWLTDNHGGEPNYPFFDRMAFHNYNDFRNYWDGAGTTDPEIVGKTGHLRENQLYLPGEFDLRSMPVIASEVGIPSGPTDQWTTRSEDHQAAYVGQVFARSLAAGLESAIWYTAEDNEADTGQCGNPYAWKTHGILRATWVAELAADCPVNPLPGYAPSEPHAIKPAYEAFLAYAWAIGDAELDRRLTTAETGSASIEAWRVTRADGRAAIVAFTDNGERLGHKSFPPPPTRSFTVDASKLPGWTGRVRVTDYLGNSRVETGSSVTVQVDWHPVYLAVEP